MADPLTLIRSTLETGPVSSIEHALEIERYEASDEAGVLALLQSAFGSWPRGFEGVDPREFFRWKHLGCPFGPSIMLLAKHDTTIVGFGAWMPWPLRVGGLTYEAMRGVDFAVHPSYRRLGIAGRILKAAAGQLPTDLALTFSNPNDMSGPMAVKGGRILVKGVPSFVRLERPLTTIGRIVADRSGARPGMRSGTRSGGWSDVWSSPEVAALPAVDVLTDERVPQLLVAVEQTVDRYGTVVSPAYLRWRYGTFDRYRAVTVGDGGERLRGLAIFRLGRRGSTSSLRVCELLVAAGERQVGRRLLRRVARTAPVDFLSCHFPTRRAAALYGFVPASATTLTAFPRRAGLDPDPRRRSSWRLSLGDLEVL